MGDPVVRRRDGSISYQLAVVVDDHAASITRVIRGKDIAPSTATQAALYGMLGLNQPTYRHHLLLLEKHEEKLAKLHGAIDIDALKDRYSAQNLCGLLAHGVGILDKPEPVDPIDLLSRFDWNTVASRDMLTSWDGVELRIGP
jgi:glutamyl-tRNA synthetase/glutamyl-Q tRNA(Asp) synthetase